MYIAADWLTVFGHYARRFQCDMVDYIRLHHQVQSTQWSACPRASSGPPDPSDWAMITANSHSEDPVEVVAAVQVGYVLGGWVAMIIHCFATELYVSSLKAQAHEIRSVNFVVLRLSYRC